MTIWDDRILEIARKEDSVSPKKLEDTGYIRVTRQQISRRLRKLADKELLLDLGNGVYVITEQGEAYLDGELSTYDDEPNGTLETENDGPSASESETS
jgi:predicted transcriptional regulator